MRYYICTIEKVRRFYAFPIGEPPTAENFWLVEQFEPDELPSFIKKSDAVAAAQAMGLKTWSYVMTKS